MIKIDDDLALKRRGKINKRIVHNSYIHRYESVKEDSTFTSNELAIQISWGIRNGLGGKVQ